MKSIHLIICGLLTLVILSFQTHGTTLSNVKQVEMCSFYKKFEHHSWWENGFDSLPNTVNNNSVTGEPEFCEFYQFAEEWFLFLISPQSTNAAKANWENQSLFPLLELAGTNSCDKDAPAHSFNVRNIKSADDTSPFELPGRIDQASAEAIYDQQGNVVFYEIRFSKNLCNYKDIQAKPNFPGKTLELKMAWRVMTDEHKANDYYQTSATINGKPYQLGLVGWHIVITADNHPEMVWVTVDHRNNAVVCDQIGSSQRAYDFTSPNCAKNMTQCNNLNLTLDSNELALPTDIQPNDICQVYPFGTSKSSVKTSRDWLNIALIKKLNQTLQNKILYPSPDLPDSFAVWKNYQITGALWVSDISEDSSESSNQRGSLELANTVMETTFQGDPHTGKNTLNCFVCHNYKGSDNDISNTSLQANLSHIFDDIIEGQCKDFKPNRIINNQSQANATCPQVCSTQSFTWNGQWTNQDAKTGTQLPMTVCGCCP